MATDDSTYQPTPGSRPPAAVDLRGTMGAASSRAGRYGTDPVPQAGNGVVTYDARTKSDSPQPPDCLGAGRYYNDSVEEE